MATRRNTQLLNPSNLPPTAAEHVTEGASLYSSPVFHGYSLWLGPSAGEGTFPRLLTLCDDRH